VGVALRGVEVWPCVSQGAAPLGPEATITAADGNIIIELAGRPALETVERIIGGLSPHERALVAQGLLMGIVIDGGKPEYEQGDFLVRGVLGADRESGALVIGATVDEGQVVRLHARDARSADQDLHRALRLRADALPEGDIAGALLFSCNGRGRAMFGTDDHDVAVLERELGGAPAAGFFAAGEIGPVGGRSFLHGFTATVAVFPR
jgi:small ligand-binding sensory domain FIST